ncbi:hypothetical protein SEPCBS119000_002676 [Sporothrix epigloea]|uniref:TeaA receptor TeaR n=1 Tax=Sporothrix epigloea TaxID=1892477 RepID=A0ABP0DIR0_9PEZI
MTTAGSVALTPPTSPHGKDSFWESSLSSLQHTEEPRLSQKSTVSDHTTHPHTLESRRQSRVRDANTRHVNETGQSHDLASNSSAVGLNKRAAGDTQSGDWDDVNSKWIHRDKLARIENEELQAAGIILPRPRGRSKPRRGDSQEKLPSQRRPVPESEPTTESQSQKSPVPLNDDKLVDTPFSGWDLRLPDEIAEESYFVTAHGSRGSSRIPVAKLSPVPIAWEHIERDTPMARRRDDSSSIEERISYPKTRARSASVRLDDEVNGGTPPLLSRNMTRSASDISPKKVSSTGGGSAAPGLRKTSAQSKASSAAGRPRTRNDASKDSVSSGTGATRPSTRSGDRELTRENSAGAASKQPEGDPPWMISAYRPDPRLPPDQQLLPTVARRLQQEKWEREGKFGNVYDREFRPLTDEGYLSPPEASEKTAEATEPADPSPQKRDEWPLKPDAKALASQPGRTSSYTTIPKIQEKPTVSPLPTPQGQLPRPANASPPQPAPHAQKAEAESSDGCGCCIVM